MSKVGKPGMYKINFRLKSNRPMIDMFRIGLVGVLVKAVSALLAIGMFAAIARITTADDFGVFAFAFSVASLLAVAGSFGQRMFGLKMAAIHHAREEISCLQGVFIFGLSSVAVGCAMSGLIFYTATNLFPHEPWAGYYWPTLALVFAMGFAEYLANFFRGYRGLVFALGPRDILWRLSVIAVCLFVGLTHSAVTISGLLYVSASALVLLAVGQIVFSRDARGLLMFNIRSELRPVSWAKNSLGLWATSMMHTVSGPILPPVILGVVLSPEEIGPFFAALRISLALDLFTVAMNMVIAPVVAKTSADNEADKLQKTLARAMLVVAPPTVFVFLIIVFQGDWLLGLMNPKFSSAAAILTIISASYLVSILTGPCSQIMSMSGLEWDMFRILSVTTGIFAIAIIPAILVGNALGAAIAIATFKVAVSLLLTLRIRKKLHVDPTIFSLRTLSK